MAADRVARIQEHWRRERPDLDVAPLGVLGRLHRLAGLLTDELTAVYARHGLGEGEFDVLATLRRAGQPYELPAGELATHTMVTTGGLTKRIDRLERAGLVTRRRNTADARGRIVALTPAGRERIDRAFTEHIANEHRLVAQLPPDDARQLERLLTSWLACYESQGPGPRSDPNGQRMTFD